MKSFIITFLLVLPCLLGSESLVAQPCFTWDTTALSVKLSDIRFVKNDAGDTIYAVIPDKDYPCSIVYPFIKTGKEWVSYYENGHIRSVGGFARWPPGFKHFLQDLFRRKGYRRRGRHGQWSYYNEDGSLKSIKYFRYDVRVDENGKKMLMSREDYEGT